MPNWFQAFDNCSANDREKEKCAQFGIAFDIVVVVIFNAVAVTSVFLSFFHWCVSVCECVRAFISFFGVISPLFFTQFPCCTLWTNLIIKMYIIKIFSRAVCRWLWCFIFWLNWFSTHVMGHTLMMMGMICFSWQSIKIQIFHFLGERKHFRWMANK